MTGGVHPRLAVNALCSRDWTFDQDLALWRKVRLHHVSLWARKLDQDRRAKIAALRAAGMRIATVVSGTVALDAPRTWAASRAAIASSVRDAVATEGRSVYVTPGRSDGRSWHELLDAFADAVGPSVADAAAHGVRLSIEPSLRCDVSFVNTLRDAVDVAEATGVGLVVDFGNCWMERDFEKVVRKAAPHIGLVQLCDIRLGPGTQAAGDRVLPGEGFLPLARMLTTVLDTGYDGLFDLEVLGPDIEREGYESTVGRGARIGSELLASLGI